MNEESVPPVVWCDPNEVVVQEDPIGLVKTRLKLIEKMMRSILKKEIDFGLVPGTKKNTLFKAGAEKIALAFGLTCTVKQDTKFLDDGHLVVFSEVYLIKDGSHVSKGVGLCSSKETKYSRRYVDEETDVLVPKAYWDAKDELVLRDALKEYDKKIRLSAYKKGQYYIKKRVIEENEVVPDTWNTVMKMSKKRAFVDAVITFSGVSSLFTQDMEDFSKEGDDF